MAHEALTTVVGIKTDEIPDEASDYAGFDIEEARSLMSDLMWIDCPEIYGFCKRLPPRRDDEPDAMGKLRDMLDAIATAWGEVVDQLGDASMKAEELVAEMEEAGDA